MVIFTLDSITCFILKNINTVFNVNNITIISTFLGSPAHPLLSLALSYPEEQGGSDKDANQDISSVRY